MSSFSFSSKFIEKPWMYRKKTSFKYNYNGDYLNPILTRRPTSTGVLCGFPFQKRWFLKESFLFEIFCSFIITPIFSLFKIIQQNTIWWEGSRFSKKNCNIFWTLRKKNPPFWPKNLGRVSKTAFYVFISKFWGELFCLKKLSFFHHFWNLSE